MSSKIKAALADITVSDDFQVLTTEAVARWLPAEKLPTLNAYLGVGGHPQRPLWSDGPYVQRCIRGVDAEFAAHIGQDDFNDKLFMVEFTDDVGIASALNPIVRYKAVVEKAAKAVTVSKLGGICAPHLRAFLGHPSLGKLPGLLVTARSLVFAPSETSADALVSLLKQLGRFKCSVGASAVTSKLVAEDGVMEAVEWLFERPVMGVRFSEDVNGAKLSEFRKVTMHLRLRLLEALSQMEVPETIVTAGAGVAIWRRVKTPLHAYHMGRLQIGHPVGFMHDTWAHWARLRKDHGPNSCLPMRFDKVSRSLQAVGPLIKRRANPFALARELNPEKNKKRKMSKFKSRPKR